MKITISPDYAGHRDFISRIPDCFEYGEGELLFSGRNEIRAFRHRDVIMVAKRFRPLDVLKQVVYTWIRPNKAWRSYHNATELRTRGFDTPHEIACIECRKHGLIRQVYYVCAYCDRLPLADLIAEDDAFDRDFTVAFARFVARLHAHGVVHHDLNNTNVVWEKRQDGYAFSLIDINRMTFYEGEMPLARALKNLTLFSNNTPQFRFFLQNYIAERHLSQSDYVAALAVKDRHDAHWRRKKRITRNLKAAFRKAGTP